MCENNLVCFRNSFLQFNTADPIRNNISRSWLCAGEQRLQHRCCFIYCYTRNICCLAVVFSLSITQIREKLGHFLSFFFSPFCLCCYFSRVSSGCCCLEEASDCVWMILFSWWHFRKWRAVRMTVLLCFMSFSPISHSINNWWTTHTHTHSFSLSHTRHVLFHCMHVPSTSVLLKLS